MARRPRGEGSVYRRGDGRWVGMLDLGRDPATGKRRRKAIYGRTQRDVVRDLAKARRELETHGDLPTANLTVETWLRTWLTDIAPERIRPTTLPSYRSKVERHIIPAIGRHRLDKLAPEHLRGMYRGMTERGLSEATRLQTHRILSRALKVAVREGKANRNAATLVDAPPTTVVETEPLNPTEIAAVLEALAGDRMESRWLAALTLGMRQGEALGLGWDDVNLDDATLTVSRALARIPGRGLVMVPPKSRKSARTVPLPRILADSLRRRWDAYQAESQAEGYTDLRLVWGRPDGRPTDPRVDWEAWRDLLDRASVQHVRLHDARHCAASTLGALGVPLPVTMQILGHSQISMTMRYTHTDLTAMQAAMALVDAHHQAIEA
jgi:integrase